MSVADKGHTTCLRDGAKSEDVSAVVESPEVAQAGGNEAEGIRDYGNAKGVEER